ncbi:MAG: 3-phosphoshikimate 1-carboxyvinyltransferase [Gammaproteobacteria bacterium]
MGSSNYQLEPGGNCNGSVNIPGDKSISHRAVMLASIADGVSEITGFLPSTDCEATLSAFQCMGVKVERITPSHIRIHGVGNLGLAPPDSELNMGNSGTAMRLLSGILCGQKFSTKLIGDESLTKRPMQRIQTPLLKMGAKIALSTDGTPPIIIDSPKSLRGINYPLPMASAQVKSCVLLAGLYADSKTCVQETSCSRDHTERMLQSFSYPVEIEKGQICLEGGGKLKASSINIPGDISSAAFFIVGALISQSSKLVIENVGINPTRDGVIEILRLMGASINIINTRQSGFEPVADLVINNSTLNGIDIPKRLIARSIDEFPIIFIAAACAKGTTTLSGAEELRVKESDRIHNMVVGLQQIGINAQEQKDGLTIVGGKITGGEVDSAGDHRIAMAFAISALVSEKPITISKTENVDTSFPNFVSCAKQVGLRFR